MYGQFRHYSYPMPPYYQQQSYQTPHMMPGQFIQQSKRPLNNQTPKEQHKVILCDI